MSNHVLFLIIFFLRFLELIENPVFIVAITYYSKWFCGLAFEARAEFMLEIHEFVERFFHKTGSAYSRMGQAVIK